MRLLKTAFHPDISPDDITETSPLTVLQRQAARAIVVRGEQILLLYTEYYDDYSLPGGGVEKSEDITVGLVRELQEETGARGVCNIKPFARYVEYRPWYKTDADILHMISDCFVCDIDEQLGDTALEAYEISNGMKPKWVNIYQAIAHNESVMASSTKKGLSIERETYLLKVITRELLA